VRAHESDYKNGNPSFPEVDRLMAKLLGYPDSDYYGSVDDFPKMVPLRRWVKASQHDLVHIFPGGNGLRHGVERFPSDYALVLMHDFDVLDLYLDAVENGYKNQQQATSSNAAKRHPCSGRHRMRTASAARCFRLPSAHFGACRPLSL